MALPKLFQRIFWHNNTTPDINEDNLNAMSKAIDDIDNRLITIASDAYEKIPEIEEDMEILGPAVENIDANVTRAETAADNAEADALKSEGYAAGTQDGVEVTSGEYYQKNAKYYAEIANPPIENIVGFMDVITISDAINKAAKDVRLKVEAVQDLHGYDRPWVGGAGKNILPLTIANLKTANTGGTWSGNNYTYNGMTFACQVNDDGAVTGIKITGTNGGSATVLGLNLSITTSSNMILSGCPSGGGASNYQLDLNAGVYADQGSGATVPSGTTLTGWRLRIGANYAVPSEGMWFYPMIRKSTESADFEPYTNICPVTGWTGAKLTVANENLFNGTYNEFVYCPIPKNTQFTASIDASASGVYFGVYDKYKNTIDYWILSNTTPDGKRKYRVITLAKDVYYVKFYSAQGSNYAVKLGDDKVFSPYAKTYTIDLDGTRYGGTLDVTSGVLTLTYGEVDLGSLTWYSGNGFFDTDVQNVIPLTIDMKCSHYPVNTQDYFINNPTVIGITASGTSKFRIYNTSYATGADVKTALSGVQLVYHLATPQTIQLTAEEVDLLYGYNTLFGDCGDISLTYDASGIIHIDEAKLDTETLKTIAAASSDFADFKARIAAL